MKGLAALRLELLGAVPTDHPVRLAALAEAASDEHPYGPWSGGSKASGGHMAGGGGLAKSNDANLVMYNGRLTHRDHLAAGGIKVPPYEGKVPVVNTLAQTKAPALKPKRTRKPKPPMGDHWTKDNAAPARRIDRVTIPKKPTLTSVKAQMVRGTPALKGNREFKAEWVKPPRLLRDIEGRAYYTGTVRFSAPGVRTKDMIVNVDNSGSEIR